MGNTHVQDSAHSSLLKLFKHWSQSFYPKTKGGVHGATQDRSTPQSSRVLHQMGAKDHRTDYLGYCFPFQSLVKRKMGKNFLFKWLSKAESFRCLYFYFLAINWGKLLGSFILEFFSTLLRHSEKMSSRSSEPQTEEEDLELHSKEGQTSCTLLKTKERCRVAFFSSELGVAIILGLHPHQQRYTGKLKHCEYVTLGKTAEEAILCAFIVTLTSACASRQSYFVLVKLHWSKRLEKSRS